MFSVSISLFAKAVGSGLKFPLSFIYTTNTKHLLLLAVGTHKDMRCHRDLQRAYISQVDTHEKVQGCRAVLINCRVMQKTSIFQIGKDHLSLGRVKGVSRGCSLGKTCIKREMKGASSKWRPLWKAPEITR